MIVVAFWLAAGAVAYSYVGFPLLVLARSKMCPRPWSPAAEGGNPTVTVVIAAHNEERAIAAKIRTVLEQDYDGEVGCVVVSDGSTDRTVEEARSVDARGSVSVLDAPRLGKAEALNLAIAESTGEIVVFTDANSALATDALRHLVAPFADPEVGGVAGDQRYVGRDGESAGERSYWSLDRLMKVAESEAGHVISATGALYAIRRELTIEVPEGVTDDFTISTAVIDQGRRLVFAENAVAYEPPAAGLDDEYQRKVRVMTRGLRAVLLRRRLLDPRRTGFYAVQLFSHKLLRRLSVVPLLVAISAAIVLRRRPGYRVPAAAGSALVVATGAGALLSRSRFRGNRLVSLCSYFGMVNLAALHALWNVLTGKQIRRWTPQRTTS